MINKGFPWRINFFPYFTLFEWIICALFFMLWILFIHPTNLCAILCLCANCTLFPFLNSMCKCLCLQWPLHKECLNYILPLFPFCAYYLSEEGVKVIWGLQLLTFIIANWNFLSSSHTRRRTHIQHDIEEVLVCTWNFVYDSNLTGFPVTLES